ncbi:MFS transporter [Actinokineospora sp. HUAS TT18]|uniref:MFS transporter n=1 Tax=Actinokineospora sp. HUAS TT18 TaxID=3447451 RepID=UPI003F5262FA
MTAGTATRDRHLVVSNRDYRQLFLGDALSQFGSQVVLLALPLTGLIALGASTFEVGLLAACSTFPLLVVGLLAGAWVDRMRRGAVMIFCDLSRAMLLSSVPAAWALDVLTMGQLYVVALLVGTSSVFFDVAYTSYLPQLVPKARLVEGNAALQTMHGVSSTAGPSLGGGLIQLVTAPFALFAAAFGYLWSAICVVLMDNREPRAARAVKGTLISEIGEGIRFLLGHRLLRVIMGCSASLNLFASVSGVTLIILLARDLSVPPSTMGLLFSAAGVGGVIGGLLVAKLTRRLGQGPVLCAAAGTLGIPVLLMPLVQRDWRLALLAAVLFTTAFGGIIYNVTVLSFRQASTPTHLLGRVNASARVLIAGTMPLGNLIGGALADAIGARNTLWIAGAGAATSFLWIYLSPIRTLRELPTE